MIEPRDASDRLSLRDFMRPLWRFKFLIVVVAVAATVATYIDANHKMKTFSTSTEVFVGQSQLDQLLDPTVLATNTLADDAHLVDTPAVADRVAKNLKLSDSGDALLGSVSTSPATGSDFITITAHSSDPSLAAHLANGFALAYLQLSRKTLVTNAKSALRAAGARLRRLPKSSRNSDVGTALQTEIDSLENAIVNPPSAAQVIRAADVPTTALSPTPRADAGFALVISLVLCGILAYVFDRGGSQIATVGQLEDITRMPVLAAVPRARRRRRRAVSFVEVPGELREAHRTLRINIELWRDAAGLNRLGGGSRPKAVLITSSLPSEGKSLIVRNLALTYRDAGDRVAVVEADLRQPVLASRLDLAPAPGLRDVLIEGREPVMQTVSRGLSDPNGCLDVLVAGAPVRDPTALLAPALLRGLINELAQNYDVVLIDSPPLLVVGDALPLLGVADGVVVVARAEVVTNAVFARTRATIERVSLTAPVHMLGVVGNEIADALASSGEKYSKQSRESQRDRSTPSAAEIA